MNYELKDDTLNDILKKLYINTDSGLEYEDFDKQFSDLSRIGLAYTETEDEKHSIQFEVNLKDYTYTLYVDDTAITVDSLTENATEEDALKTILQDMQYGVLAVL